MKYFLQFSIILATIISACNKQNIKTSQVEANNNDLLSQQASKNAHQSHDSLVSATLHKDTFLRRHHDTRYHHFDSVFRHYHQRHHHDTANHNHSHHKIIDSLHKIHSQYHQH